MDIITIAVSKQRAERQEVEAYLPRNFSLTGETADHFIVTGRDHAGWTANGYVIPRLGSGWIHAEIVEGS